MSLIPSYSEDFLRLSHILSLVTAKPDEEATDTEETLEIQWFPLSDSELERAVENLSLQERACLDQAQEIPSPLALATLQFYLSIRTLYDEGTDSCSVGMTQSEFNAFQELCAEVITERETLDPFSPTFIQILFSCGRKHCDRLMSIVPRDSVQHILKQEEIRIDDLTREILEREPSLDARVTAGFIYAVARNCKLTATFEHILLRLQFYQSISNSLVGTLSPSYISPEDSGFLFLLASCKEIEQVTLFRPLIPSDYHMRDFPQERNEFHALKERWEKEGSCTVEFPTDRPFPKLLALFYHDLQHHPTSFKFILDQFCLASSIPADNRTKEDATGTRELLVECGDIIFAFCTFKNSPLYHKASPFLDSLFNKKPSTSHIQALHNLRQHLFNDSSSAGTYFGLILYKTWWFNDMKYLSSDTLVNRAIDWIAVELFENYGSLTCQEFAERVSGSFRENYPYLPFNTGHTWSTYFRLDNFKKRDNPL